MTASRRLMEAVLVGMTAMALLLLSSRSALASPDPPPPQFYPDPSQLPGTAVSAGSPMWIFAVTALISAVVAIAVTLAVAHLISMSHAARLRAAA
jgi:hypothetical protein